MGKGYGMPLSNAAEPAAEFCMTIDDVYLTLHQAARSFPGGIRALAQRLGRREKTLYSKLDPHDEAHEPTLGEFVALLMCVGESDQVEVLDRLCAVFGYSVSTRVRAREASLTHAVLRSVKEQADVAQAVADALADGSIDVSERAQIMREISDARRSLAVIENTLAADVGVDAQ